MAKRLILVISIVLLVSCASRKVDVVKNNTKTTIDSVAIVKTDGTYVKDNNIAINETIEEIEYKPVDTSKAMVVNGKEYFNVTIKAKKHNIAKTDKTKVESKVTITNKVALKKEDKKEVMEKHVKKEANYFVYLWLLLIPIIYFIYKQAVKRFLV